MSVQTISPHIGARVREYRNSLKITQGELAERMGFNSSQIVSQIEAGSRELKARELVKVAEILHTSVQNLLSAEQAEIPESRWRDKPNEGFEPVEARFCLRCERYSLLEEWCGERLSRDFPSVLAKGHLPTVGELERAAEDVRTAMKLGGRPAASLGEILEEDYGVKVFYDSFEGTALCASGKFGNAILLNRDNVKWRRNFSLAHELYHLLVPGVYEDEEIEERHAQVFASALLMPSSSLMAAIEAKVQNGKVPVRDLVVVAQEFHVSTEALLWRLCSLQRMSREQVRTLLTGGAIKAFESIGQRKNDHPDELPDRYIRLAYQAYNRGKIGLAKLAEFLETTAGQLVASSNIWNSDADLNEEAEIAFA